MYTPLPYEKLALLLQADKKCLTDEETDSTA